MPGLKQYRHPKTGILYIYHRATGRRLLSEPGTPAFLAELAALNETIQQQVSEAAKPKSLGALIKSYKGTDAWTDLAPRTKRDYEKVIGFLKPLYDMPVQTLTAPRIVELRDKWRHKRGRRFVNYCLTLLTLLMDRGVELGLLNDNPADQVKRVKRDKNIAPLNRQWTEAERQAVTERTATLRYKHLALPLAIGLCLGIREGDMIHLPRTIVKGGRIAFETAKRRVWIDLEVLPELATAIAVSPPHDAITLCANSRGRPWSQDGFRASFFKMLRALEEEGVIGSGLTYHGLRHTVASLLAERGVSTEDIAAVLGQKSSKVAAMYAEKADRTRRASAAIQKLRPLKQTGK